VIFRDGVGDGQLDTLADHEVKQMQRSFLTFGEEYQPRCATVVVQKRINTRIFSQVGLISACFLSVLRSL